MSIGKDDVTSEIPLQTFNEFSRPTNELLDIPSVLDKTHQRSVSHGDTPFAITKNARPLKAAIKKEHKRAFSIPVATGIQPSVMMMGHRTHNRSASKTEFQLPIREERPVHRGSLLTVFTHRREKSR